MKQYVDHPLITSNTVEFREYQVKLAKKAISNNLLCVLPTGTGKTMIAVLAGAEILEKEHGSILFLSPSKPLCGQHKETFEKCYDLSSSKIKLVTGEISPSDRNDVYNDTAVIVATPQTIRNDIKARRTCIHDFSFVTFDEAQRAVKKYPYTFIAAKYVDSTSTPRILGLTASPGSSKDRIERVCSNLFIDSVEIKERNDSDVKPYVQTVKIEKKFLRLPPRVQKIKRNVEQLYKEYLRFLKEHSFLDSIQISRKKLLQLRAELVEYLQQEDPDSQYFKAMSITAAALKLSHTLELLETQGITSLHNYLHSLFNDDSKAAKRIRLTKNFIKAIKITDELHEEDYEHPKLPELLKIVQKHFNRYPSSRIIVFVRYRDSVQKIVSTLKANGFDAEKLVGQREGLTQSEQMDTLNEFQEGNFNVLITTSVGEEGLDVPSCKLAVFYDIVPSAIRSIQRKGRVGRTRPGKVVLLITKDTREEAYYWVTQHRKKQMKKILKKYQTPHTENDNQKDLTSFTS